MKTWFLTFALCFWGLTAFAQTKKIPQFSFQDTEHNIFTNKDIPEKSALLLIYFRTDCDECRHTAQVISKTAGQYTLMIWMVSPNKLDYLDAFEYMTGLYKLNNVQVLQDNKDIMHKLFDFSALPFMVLYNKDGTEIKTYHYLPNAQTIRKDLK